MSPPAPLPGEVTAWLSSLDEQAETPTNLLFGLLYKELKRGASAQLRRELPGHTLNASALAHEAWFRLASQDRTRWESRSHFLGVASVMMRRILINHAAARQTDKRQAQRVSLTLPEAELVSDSPTADVLAVHEALLAFEAVDPRAAKVVELKFFGGLENEEIASVLEISLATVKRDWALARAWLHRELGT
ncbi:ECF-type sigma factor [Ideonella sp.]|uniref:ECF-type sigma factor n=1 Tax=Ideonella sp. TaxID=1929293 RepID=UPI003BB6D058